MIEPLRLLFKDEVRQIAEILGVPETVVKRQHYPSAGIALRCMGAVDGEKLAALRQAEEILRETLEESGQNKPSTQAFAVLADFSSAFLDGVPRYVVILRAVNASGEGDHPRPPPAAGRARARSGAHHEGDAPRLPRGLRFVGRSPGARRVGVTSARENADRPWTDSVRAIGVFS